MSLEPKVELLREAARELRATVRLPPGRTRSKWAMVPAAAIAKLNNALAALQIDKPGCPSPDGGEGVLDEAAADAGSGGEIVPGKLTRHARVDGRDFRPGQLIQQVLGRAYACYDRAHAKHDAGSGGEGQDRTSVQVAWDRWFAPGPVPEHALWKDGWIFLCCRCDARTMDDGLGQMVNGAAYCADHVPEKHP